MPEYLVVHCPQNRAVWIETMERKDVDNLIAVGKRLLESPRRSSAC